MLLTDKATLDLPDFRTGHTPFLFRCHQETLRGNNSLILCTLHALCIRAFIHSSSFFSTVSSKLPLHTRRTMMDVNGEEANTPKQNGVEVPQKAAAAAAANDDDDDDDDEVRWFLYSFSDDCPLTLARCDPTFPMQYISLVFPAHGQCCSIRWWCMWHFTRESLDCIDWREDLSEWGWLV